MPKQKKKRDWRTVISLIVLFSFIIPIGFLIYRIIVAPSVVPADGNIRVKSDYVLMLLQCILGVVAMILPSIFSKKFKLIIPNKMYFVFVLFLYCAITLGEVRNFYYLVPHWDTVLHALSGAMLGALGFSVIALLNREHVFETNLTPFFVAFFAFCFAITLGVFWEIYEYTFDGLLGLNMQKFALEGGEGLVGRAALNDTMKDLIVDCIGAGIMCIIGYISLKYKKGWIEQFIIKFDK